MPLSADPGADPGAEPGRDFTAEQIAAGKAFHAALRAWSLAAVGVRGCLTALLGLTPLGARLVEGAGRVLGGGWVAQVVGGVLALSVLATLVGLPLRARAESVLRSWGVSTRSWAGWGRDVVKGWGLSTGLLAAAALAFFALVRADPGGWWVTAGVGAAGLVALLSLVVPVLVEPVFARFTPLPDGPLREELAELAAAAGVRVRQSLVADASRRTTSLNAYVSGLGATRRIVVFDTLLASAPRRQVRLVVAHELGHARRRDVARLTLLGMLAAAAAMPALAVLGAWRGLFVATGSAGLGDPRALPLLLALAGLAAVLAQPGQMLLSRRIEARADRDALDLTGDADGFAQMQRSLALANRADVDPPRWVRVWFGSHPSALERIVAARGWAREHGVAEPEPMAGMVPADAAEAADAPEAADAAEAPPPPEEAAAT